MKSGNNMPVQAPLVPDPILPYSCKNSRTVYAVCEVEEAVLRRHLSPTPFNFVNNRCMVYVNDFTESPELPYMDAGIIFTVEYKGVFGGYYMYEWEDDDAAIETGRYWGYPKKFGTMTLEKNGDLIRGTASRRGAKLIDIELDCGKPLNDVPQLHTVYPHLNLLTIPNPDGPGIFSQRVTARDNSSTCTLLSNTFAEVKVKLNSSPTDPIGEFSNLKVLGGGYSVTDFLASEENGWARVIDTII
ncbi:acetoacetate decarboxylase family protein [Falsochrobactrum sp. TDYN1]|uniref:Acetoacetate decarboxylase family protein n=1 Tax=Falsochrobactrum tianjinense TaxID=2706015 RepID=A0A949UU79_9HYPH|nr:acetoacetate decarboxylase family protein [Falsochrobactrum sp. TDYN1]MBV2143101.1 acetoacetate decarboxylase family protein [Falsochrobactrum sp. TDYN1]